MHSSRDGNTDVSGGCHFSGFRKVYIEGPAGVRVPMREVRLGPAGRMDGREESYPALRLYDTSGPYTDPQAEIDPACGLPELRKPWILARGSYDVREPSYRPVAGHSDPDAALPRH